MTQVSNHRITLVIRPWLYFRYKATWRFRKGSGYFYLPYVFVIGPGMAFYRKQDHGLITWVIYGISICKIFADFLNTCNKQVAAPKKQTIIENLFTGKLLNVASKERLNYS